MNLTLFMIIGIYELSKLTRTSGKQKNHGVGGQGESLFRLFRV